MADKPTDNTNEAQWAAYVLGHHCFTVSGWQDTWWSMRDSVAEGRTPPPTLPAEAADLPTALRILARETLIDAATAVEMAFALEQWLQACREMVREMHSPNMELTEVDWDDDYAPGLRPSSAFGRATDGLFGNSPRLRLWCNLGYELAKRSHLLFPQGNTDETRDFLNLIRRLDPRKEISFLQDVHRAVAHPPSQPPDTAPVPQLCHPTGGVCGPRLDAYIRHWLLEGSSPNPWIVLTRERYRLFGREIDPNTLPFKLAAILWVLCENPRRPLQRDFIIKEGNLCCQPNGLNPYTSRLRQKVLRPGIETFFSGLEVRPDGYDEMFIRGHRDHQKPLGPIELLIDPLFVVVRGPRLDLMPSTPSSPLPPRNQAPQKRSPH